MKTLILITLSFTAGFLIPRNDTFYREAIKAAYEYGRQSIVLEAIE